MLLPLYAEQLCSVFDYLTVCYAYFSDDSALVRTYLIHELHCLDDAEDLSFFHLVADRNIRLRILRRRGIEYSDDR